MLVLNALYTGLLAAATTRAQDINSSATSESATATATVGDVSSTGTSVDSLPSASATDDYHHFLKFNESNIDQKMRCQKSDYTALPFCQPKNGSVWRTDGKYTLTWDSNIWSVNSSVKIVLNYAEPGDRGDVAAEWELDNAFGFQVVQPQEDWLYNQTDLNKDNKVKVVNQTMYFVITSNDVTTDGARNLFHGPTVILTSASESEVVNSAPRDRPRASFFGLLIGLPLVFGFVVAVLCSTHFCMSRQRQVGPIAIGGGRRHFGKGGYNGRKARRNRTAGGSEARYADDPMSPTGQDMNIERTPEERRRSQLEMNNFHGR